MEILPYDIKSPAMTAMLEHALNNIVTNSNGNSDAFVENIISWLNDVFAKCTTPEAVTFIRKIISATQKNEPVFNCEKCGSPLKLLKGKFGLFFLCTNEECKQTYQERNKKPLPLFDAATAPKCLKCGSPLKQGQSKKGSLFWKCQNEKCAIFLDDSRGKPVMPEKCPDCGGLVFRHKGEYGNFWKCEVCMKNYKDVSGKPLLLSPKWQSVVQLCGTLKRKRTAQRLRLSSAAPIIQSVMELLINMANRKRTRSNMFKILSYFAMIMALGGNLLPWNNY